MGFTKAAILGKCFGAELTKSLIQVVPGAGFVTSFAVSKTCMVVGMAAALGEKAADKCAMVSANAMFKVGAPFDEFTLTQRIKLIEDGDSNIIDEVLQGAARMLTTHPERAERLTAALNAHLKVIGVDGYATVQDVTDELEPAQQASPEPSPAPVDLAADLQSSLNGGDFGSAQPA